MNEQEFQKYLIRQEKFSYHIEVDYEQKFASFEKQTGLKDLAMLDEMSEFALSFFLPDEEIHFLKGSVDDVNIQLLKFEGEARLEGCDVVRTFNRDKVRPAILKEGLRLITENPHLEQHPICILGQLQFRGPTADQRPPVLEKNLEWKINWDGIYGIEYPETFPPKYYFAVVPLRAKQ